MTYFGILLTSLKMSLFVSISYPIGYQENAQYVLLWETIMFIYDFFT